MGQPKFPKKKYEKPKKPYNKERLDREKKIMREFGLKRKKELWRAESMLRNLRRRTRELQARPNEADEKKLLEKAHKLGLIPKDGSAEDILGISIEAMLNRRLQTFIYKKGLATTIKDARQRIVHKQVLVENRKIAWPSFIVETDVEEKISMAAKKGGKQ